ADIGAKTRTAAERLASAEGPPQLSLLVLERLRDQLGAREVSLLGPNGQVLLTASNAAAASPPERPGVLLLRQARLTGVASQIEGLDEETLAGPEPASTRVRAL